MKILARFSFGILMILFLPEEMPLTVLVAQSCAEAGGLLAQGQVAGEAAGGPLTQTAVLSSGHGCLFPVLRVKFCGPIHKSIPSVTRTL